MRGRINNKLLYLITAIVSFLIGVVFYRQSGLLFWYIGSSLGFVGSISFVLFLIEVFKKKEVKDV